jgi:sugar phosphate isomerase/epimerase
MGTRILAGPGEMIADRAARVKILEKYDMILALENHPEKTPAEVLAQIGDGANGHFATCIDTGIWGSHGYDAAKAIEELQPYIVQMHLKDVLAARRGSCRFGQGIVPLKRCVDLLMEMGYQGGFSIEHEPHDNDPSEDVKASFEMLKGWLGI